MDTDIFNFSSIEDLPGLSAKAAFLVDSTSVFREQEDIAPVRVSDDLNYIPWGADN